MVSYSIGCSRLVTNWKEINWQVAGDFEWLLSAKLENKMIGRTNDLKLIGHDKRQQLTLTHNCFSQQSNVKNWLTMIWAVDLDVSGRFFDLSLCGGWDLLVVQKSRRLAQLWARLGASRSVHDDDGNDGLFDYEDPAATQSNRSQSLTITQMMLVEITCWKKNRRRRMKKLDVNKVKKMSLKNGWRRILYNQKKQTEMNHFRWSYFKVMTVTREWSEIPFWKND